MFLPTYMRGDICDFQQCVILTRVDSDKPVQPLLLSLETPIDVQSVA